MKSNIVMALLAIIAVTLICINVAAWRFLSLVELGWFR